MKKTDEVVAVVVDHGRFVHVARTLGNSFAHTYYTTPEEKDNPVLREACIGDGFDEIERVRDIWSVKDELDLAIFCDIGFECLQKELRYQGIKVWGPGDASYLESNKGLFLEMLGQTELPVPPHRVIKGLTNLKLYLKDEEDKYVKITRYRGDWETLHWTNWGEMEGVLDSYAVRFGPLKEQINFYVFDQIETEIEDGIDAYRVNGEWPETILHGMECKDKSYIGTIQKMSDIPEEVRCVNDCFGPILDRLNPDGAMKFSTEVRITEDRKSFFIDPTCRFGSPPSQGECCLIKNLAEIVWAGSNGKLVEPETEDQFVVQAFLSLCEERDEWRAVKLEDEVEEHVKAGHCCKVNGMIAFPPIPEYTTKEAGYLVATGKTLKAAIEELRRLKDDLPCGLHCDFESLADLLKEIHEAEASGMPFTREIVPEPEIITGG